LFAKGDRHLTDEMLLRRGEPRQDRCFPATIYNTLHQFTGAGLLREVTVNRLGRPIFDTNVFGPPPLLIENEHNFGR